ncbi:hypothetical protein H5410_011136 [Solanum commersonii]|uniref:Uncharacterized protein n=1 Tax=Solanum commersonii TaxID=4109 RepID=A0A9J6AMT2_SOLCO|nr:hypothetical protein H5410_011136 [Solanum commersonii]
MLLIISFTCIKGVLPVWGLLQILSSQAKLSNCEPNRTPSRNQKGLSKQVCPESVLGSNYSCGSIYPETLLMVFGFSFWKGIGKLGKIVERVFTQVVNLLIRPLFQESIAFASIFFLFSLKMSGDVFREKAGASLGNLPPSLRPPPEGGYPPLPFVEWG